MGGGGSDEMSSGYNTRTATPAPSVKSVSSEALDIEREVKQQLKKYFMKKNEDLSGDSSNED